VRSRLPPAKLQVKLFGTTSSPVYFGLIPAAQYPDVMVDILTYEFEWTLTAAGRAARDRLDRLPSLPRRDGGGRESQETFAERIDRHRPPGWGGPPPS
jgi:hypothetical protein